MLIGICRNYVCKVKGAPVLPMVLIQVPVNRSVDILFAFQWGYATCKTLAADSFQQTAGEKAQDLLLEREVNELSKDEWQGLLAGIPEERNWQVEVSRYPASLAYITDSTGQHLA